MMQMFLEKGRNSSTTAHAHVTLQVPGLAVRELAVCMCVLPTLSPLAFITSSDGCLVSHLCFGHFSPPSSLPYLVFSTLLLVSMRKPNLARRLSLSRSLAPPLPLVLYTAFPVPCPWSSANHRHSTRLSNSVVQIGLLKAGMTSASVREKPPPYTYSLTFLLGSTVGWGLDWPLFVQ